MYNAHPYFSVKNLGRTVHIIHGRIHLCKSPRDFVENVSFDFKAGMKPEIIQF